MRHHADTACRRGGFSVHLAVVVLTIIPVLLTGCGGSRLQLALSGSGDQGWYTYRGGNQNRGVAPAGRVAADRLLWVSRTGGEAATEPTVRGGLIFHAGQDRRFEVFRITDGGRVFRERFDGPVNGTLPGDAAVAFLTDQDELKLYSYPYNTRSGRSSFAVARTRAAPRYVGDSLILIAGLNGGLFCYTPDGALRWSQETDGLIFTTPAVCDTAVYVTSGRRVIAYTLRSGVRLWSHQSSGAMIGAPAVDDRVYVGAADSLLYALDLDNGGMDWFFAAGGGVYTTPAIGSDRIYVAVNDGLIYALNKATGKTIWTYDTKAVANLSPTLSGDLLYVATRTGHLVGLRTDDGTVVYDHVLRAAAVTSPVVAGSRVFVCDSHRRLYCFGADSSGAAGD